MLVYYVGASTEEEAFIKPSAEAVMRVGTADHMGQRGGERMSFILLESSLKLVCHVGLIPETF